MHTTPTHQEGPLAQAFRRSIDWMGDRLMQGVDAFCSKVSSGVQGVFSSGGLFAGLSPAQAHGGAGSTQDASGSIDAHSQSNAAAMQAGTPEISQAQQFDSLLAGASLKPMHLPCSDMSLADACTPLASAAAVSHDLAPLSHA